MFSSLSRINTSPLRCVSWSCYYLFLLYSPLVYKVVSTWLLGSDFPFHPPLVSPTISTVILLSFPLVCFFLKFTRYFGISLLQVIFIFLLVSPSTQNPSGTFFSFHFCGVVFKTLSFWCSLPPCLSHFRCFTYLWHRFTY